MRGDFEHRASPRDSDRARRRKRRQVGRSRAGHTLPCQKLLVGDGPRRRHVDDDGTSQAEPADESILELDQSSRRMDDLDPDGRFSQRPVEKASDLEPADAQALADLILGQVQPVVELGGPEHEPRLQSLLVLSEDRRVGRNAQKCNLLRICSVRLSVVPDDVKGWFKAPVRRVRDMLAGRWTRSSPVHDSEED